MKKQNQPPVKKAISFLLLTGYTQEAVARALGISRYALRRMRQSGKAPTPEVYDSLMLLWSRRQTEVNKAVGGVSV